MKKILLYALLIVVVLIAGFLGYVRFILPHAGPVEDISLDPTPEMLARGDYLANHVMACMDCHSERDWKLFSGPMIEGTQGMGGEVFDQELGFPGKYVTPNITPSNLRDWSDGEILRAVTTGVTKDGKALFPVMPYLQYGKMDKKDIIAVIAYIRTLAPIDNETEASRSDFPMNFIINAIPQKATFTDIPSKSDTVAYGEYLVTAGACYDCHTRQEKGKYVGEPFAGGMEFPLPGGSVVVSRNITPDATGIGNWNEQFFINRFRMYADSTMEPHAVAENEFQTIMPWTMYAGMKEEDLKAIFAYLKTLRPVDNQVIPFRPARK